MSGVPDSLSRQLIDKYLENIFRYGVQRIQETGSGFDKQGNP